MTHTDYEKPSDSAMQDVRALSQHVPLENRYLSFCFVVIELLQT